LEWKCCRTQRFIGMIKTNVGKETPPSAFGEMTGLSEHLPSVLVEGYLLLVSITLRTWLRSEEFKK
jgi:hypothetical protein